MRLSWLCVRMLGLLCVVPVVCPCQPPSGVARRPGLLAEPLSWGSSHCLSCCHCAMLELQ